jgi:ketol-acid reductoisomerase
MPAKELPIFIGDAVPLDGLQDKSVSVIGYGNQGKVHAQNLRDSGISIKIGARNTAPAIADGFTATTIEKASIADLVIIALPDEVQGEVYLHHIEPHLKLGATVGFIHGFAVHFGQITPPEGVGVVMVAPKGPGITVRKRYVEGSGVPALLAIHQENETNTARDLALGWCAGIGSGRVGVLESTFAHETETDLFGEQAIIVGGLAALVNASYETLVDAGYPPQLAYIECCHEVKQVADILHDRGMADMMATISNTAEMGAYEAMELLDDEHLREHLRTLLKNIQNGAFAKRLVNHEIQNKREELGNHEIEQIGKEIRSLMQSDDD